MIGIHSSDERGVLLVTLRLRYSYISFTESSNMSSSVAASRPRLADLLMRRARKTAAHKDMIPR